MILSFQGLKNRSLTCRLFISVVHCSHAAFILIALYVYFMATVPFYSIVIVEESGNCSMTSENFKAIRKLRHEFNDLLTLDPVLYSSYLEFWFSQNFNNVMILNN